MADDQPLDPAKLMQAFFAAWNQARPAAAEPQPPTEAPLSGVAAPGIAAMRLMAQALALANLPSREDIGGVADRLDRIEAQLAATARRLDQLEEAGPDVSPVAKKHKKKR